MCLDFLLIHAAKKLQVIGRAGVGVDNIDIKVIKEIFNESKIFLNEIFFFRFCNKTIVIFLILKKFIINSFKTIFIKYK